MSIASIKATIASAMAMTSASLKEAVAQSMKAPRSYGRKVTQSDSGISIKFSQCKYFRANIDAINLRIYSAREYNRMLAAAKQVPGLVSRSGRLIHGEVQTRATLANYKVGN